MGSSARHVGEARTARDSEPSASMHRALYAVGPRPHRPVELPTAARLTSGLSSSWVRIDRCPMAWSAWKIEKLCWGVSIPATVVRRVVEGARRGGAVNDHRRPRHKGQCDD